MDKERIAQELLKVARSLISGDTEKVLRFQGAGGPAIIIMWYGTVANQLVNLDKVISSVKKIEGDFAKDLRVFKGAGLKVTYTGELQMNGDGKYRIGFSMGVEGKTRQDPALLREAAKKMNYTIEN